MKTSLAAIVALAAGAYAQGIADIPSCALTCLSTALSTDGCSSLTDFACHCKHTDLIPQAQPCIQKACPQQSQQAAVVSVIEGICSSAGVPITIPVPGGSSAAPTTSAAATSTPAESSAVSTPAESSAASTPAGYGSSSAAVTPSSSAAGTVPVVTPSSNATLSATPSQFTGAAAHVTQAVGLVGLALAAVAAL